MRNNYKPRDVGSTPSSGSSSYNDFIGTYDGYFTDEFIDYTLQWYIKVKDEGLIQTIRRQHHYASDEAVSVLTQDYSDQLRGCAPMTYQLKPFTELYWQAQDEYSTKYSLLQNYAIHGIVDAKIQHTREGEGYHVWHCENSVMMVRNRILAWMLYLNDDFEGGETEFLYQKLRVKPKRGRLLIWPTAFTHTHRGGLVLKGSKYILTGWVELIDYGPESIAGIS